MLLVVFFFNLLSYRNFSSLLSPPSLNLTPMLVRQKNQAPNKHRKTCPMEFKGLGSVITLLSVEYNLSLCKCVLQGIGEVLKTQ